MRLVLPKLYVILDAALVTSSVPDLAGRLHSAGVSLFQYRNKLGTSRDLLETTRDIAARIVSKGATVLVNDRADVAALAGASGVHLGQEDLSPADGRAIIGLNKILGISTHNREQFNRAAGTTADYIAIGPIFETRSKANPDPVVGTALLKELRRLTEKPIVAIGGITLERAREVIEAGADSVAVIGDILQAADPVRRAGQFLEALENPQVRTAN